MNEDDARAVARKFAREFSEWLRTDTNIDFWEKYNGQDELEERVRRLLMRGDVK
ncbi:MAG: hypothetical protein KGO96_10245 [Elusimicrobia bacterium]|nr:hypothetical protein [Elusimicrobiota bacterium]